MFGINKYILEPESANIWLTGTFCLSKEQKTLQKLGQKPPNGTKGPQNLSARAWLYITTCHNTQVLFKQQNLIKADGPYRIIYYYEEYLWTNSHWFIARTLKAVKAKADILTKQNNTWRWPWLGCRQSKTTSLYRDELEGLNLQDY